MQAFSSFISYSNVLYGAGVTSGIFTVIVVGIEASTHSAYNVISVTSGEGSTLSSNTSFAKSHLSE